MDSVVLFHLSTMTNELSWKALSALIVWIYIWLCFRGYPKMNLPPATNECVEVIVKLWLKCRADFWSNDGSKTTKSDKSAPQNTLSHLEITIPKPRKHPDKVCAWLIVAWSFIVLMLGYQLHIPLRNGIISTKDRNYEQRNFEFGSRFS